MYVSEGLEVNNFFTITNSSEMKRNEKYMDLFTFTNREGRKNADNCVLRTGKRSK